MFGLFKKTRTDKLSALIGRQTAFSVKALHLHRKLLAAAPNRDQAIVEAFLYNNWVSYHLIAEGLLANLPRQSEADQAALRAGIAQAIITNAANHGVPELERKTGVSVARYCDGNFIGHANFTFKDFDSSVARHQTPAWQSAAIRLGVNAELGELVITDITQAMEIQKESAHVFIGLQDVIRKDVQDYYRSPN